MDSAGAQPDRRAHAATLPAAKAGSSDPKTTTPHNLATNGLKLVIADADFQDMTLDEFAEWLRRTTEANVVIRWKVLEKAGIERDATFSFKAKSIRIKEIMPQVFAALTKKEKERELAAEADDNTFVISTRKDFDSRFVTRYYDVQDLLHAMPGFAGSKLNDSNIGTGRRRSSGMVQGGQPSEHEPPSQELVKRLIDAIIGTIQPPSWKANGGKGSISYFKGQLIIRNSIEVQQQIAGMLKGTPNLKRGGG